MPRLSACLIVRDEAELLPGCLASLRPWVDELVVVDTGSQDDSLAIAEGAGAKVASFPWADDFSAARNESLALATGDWVLIVDADERLVVEDEEAWRAALAGPPGAYGLVVRNAGLAEEDPRRVVRLFPRHEALRFAGRLHESIGAGLGSLGWPLWDLHGAHLSHEGYLPERVAAKGKWARNLRLARLAWAEAPQAAYPTFNWARSALTAGELGEALAAWSLLEPMVAQGEDPHGGEYLRMLQAMAPEALKLASPEAAEALRQAVGLGASWLGAGRSLPLALGEGLLQLATELRPLDPQPWTALGLRAWEGEDAVAARRLWAQGQARGAEAWVGEAIGKLQARLGGRPRLSACLILRDEADQLPAALASLGAWADELVVLDTGSQDATVAIARAMGAVVGHRAWDDDFSAARNAALDLATGEWVLCLDADERLVVQNPTALRAALEDAAASAYLLPLENLDEAGRVSSRLTTAPRLFRRLPGLRFEGRLHEDVSGSLAALGAKPQRLEALKIQHLGYAEAIVAAKDKLARNRRLAELEAQEQPHEANAWMQLAAIASRMEDHPAALAAVERAWACQAEAPTLPRHRQASLAVIEANAHRALGAPAQALAGLERAWAGGLEELELAYELGRALAQAGRPQEAQVAFHWCLEAGARQAGHGTTREGLGGFLSHVELMALALEAQDLAQAGAHAQAAAQDPSCPPEEARRLASVASQLAAAPGGQAPVAGAASPAPAPAQAGPRLPGEGPPPSSAQAAASVGPASGPTRAEPPAATGLGASTLDPMEDKASALKVLAERPREVEAWLALALHERTLQAPDRALVALNQALQLDAGQVLGWILLGVVLAELGQPRLGEAAMAAALQLDPEHPTAQAQRVAFRAMAQEEPSAELEAFMEGLLALLNPRVSLCMIVKDEAPRLARALRSAKAFANELIVVDTGSSDESVAIAQAEGAQVFHHAWADDFAAARNAALAQATGDWVLMLDADEVLQVEEAHTLARMLRNRVPAGYVLSIVDVDAGGVPQGASAPSLRLFQRLPELRYEGRIHESLAKGLDALGAQVEATWALRLLHHGHQARVVAEKDKAQRNLALAQQEHREQPQDMRTTFKLVVAEWQAGLDAQALERMTALDASLPGGIQAQPDTLWAQMALVWAQLATSAGDPILAEALLDEAIERLPGYPAFRYERGLLRARRHDLASSAEDFRACLREKAADWSSYVVDQGHFRDLPLAALAKLGLGAQPGTTPDGQRVQAPVAPPPAGPVAAPGPQAPALAGQAPELAGPTQAKGQASAALPGAIPSREQAMARLEEDLQDVPAWLALAYHCEAEGQLDQALVALDQALALDAHPASAWRLLAKVLEALGLPQEAARAWSCLQAIHPEDEAASSERQRLRRLEATEEAPGPLLTKLEALFALAQPRVSACLIVRDEAERLGACLEALRPWVDELVVLDTGSVDATMAIAEAGGARVLPWAWQDDFAAARNAAIEAAEHEWILMVDADERLVVEDVEAWRRALLRRVDLAHALTLEDLDEQGEVALRFGTVRLFQRRPELRYQGRLHESLSGALHALGAVARSLPGVVLRHDGHHAAAMLAKGKAARNLRLAELEHQEAPHAAEGRLKLAVARLGQVPPAESIAEFEALAQEGWAGLGDPLLAHAVGLQVRLLRDAGLEAEAEAWLDRALARLGGFPDLHLERAACRASRGEFDAAGLDLRACLAAAGRDFGALAVRAGATDLLPRQALAQLGLPEAGPVAHEALQGPWGEPTSLRAGEAPPAGSSASSPAGPMEGSPPNPGASAPAGGEIPGVAEAKATLAQRPRDAVAWLTLAWHALESGAPDKALVALQQHLQVEASRAAGWALLGLVLDQLGLPRFAERAWRLALSWDPEHPSAQGQLVRLRQQPQEEDPSPEFAAQLEALLALGQPRLSACMIVKNEEANLSRCLASLQGWVDELIVVDTGSTDGTVAIAEASGAKVLHHAWHDDFSLARNLAFEAATGDWLLVVDADEELELLDPEAFRRTLAQREPAGYVAPLMNLNADGSPAGELVLLRLVQNLPTMRMTGALHENFGEAIQALDWPVWQTSSFRLRHHGYAQGATDLVAKGVRNLEIAEAELAAKGPSPERLLNVARSAQLSGHRLRAHQVFRQLWAEGHALQLPEVHWTLLVVSHLNLLRQEGDLPGALELVGRGLERMPSYPDFWYEQALLKRDLGDWEGAQEDLFRLLALEPHLLEMRVDVRADARALAEALSHPLPNAAKVSACLIVKNEAERLARCLQSVQPWVDELIVIDTGSTDQTVAIAEAFGAKVGHFAWCEDFSAARNAAIEAASGDWILAVDADECLWVAEPEAWHHALAEAPPELGAFVFPILNRQADGTAVVSPMLRLFRRDPRVRYQGRLHEEVVATLEAAGLGVAPLQGVHLIHDGYLPEVVEAREKHPRNLRLAIAETEDHPDRPLAWYNLARSALFTGDTAMVTQALAQVGRLLAEGQVMGEAPYCGYVALQRRLWVAEGRRSEAEVLLGEALLRVPGYPEFHYERGLLRLERGDRQGAIADFQACLQPSGRYYTAAVRPEVLGPWPTERLQALGVSPA